jgi:hypothetical protein
MRKRGLLLCTLALTLAACATDDTDDSRAALTQREKDSILAGSQIPGAKAVKKTLTTADSAAARAARLDSAQQNP